MVYYHVRATACFEVYAADVGGGQFGAAVEGVRMRRVICKVEMCELEALPADLARFEELCENVGNGNKAGAGEVVAAVAGRVVFGTTDEVNEAVLSVQAAARNANRHLVADRYEQRRQALQSSKPPPESLLFEAKGRRSAAAWQGQADEARPVAARGEGTAQTERARQGCHVPAERARGRRGGVRGPPHGSASANDVACACWKLRILVVAADRLGSVPVALAEAMKEGDFTSVEQVWKDTCTVVARAAAAAAVGGKDDGDGDDEDDNNV